MIIGIAGEETGGDLNDIAEPVAVGVEVFNRGQRGCIPPGVRVVGAVWIEVRRAGVACAARIEFGSGDAGVRGQQVRVIIARVGAYRGNMREVEEGGDGRHRRADRKSDHQSAGEQVELSLIHTVLL